MYHWYPMATQIPQGKMNLVVRIISGRVPCETVEHANSTEHVYQFRNRKLRVVYACGDYWPLQAEIEYE